MRPQPEQETVAVEGAYGCSWSNRLEVERNTRSSLSRKGWVCSHYEHPARQGQGKEMTVMPFPETRARQRPRSNGAVCRARPVWKPVILNAWVIQISATVARFRGNERSCRSGSMPLIERRRWARTKGRRVQKLLKCRSK